MIQISVSIVLLYNSISIKNDINSTLTKIDNIFKNQSNILTLGAVVNNPFKISNSSYEKLDTYLTNNSNFKLIHVNDGNFYIKPFDGIKDFLRTTYKTDANGSYYSITRGFSLSYDALKYFNLKVKAGRSFVSDDFNIKEGHDTPVILGSKYSKYFKIGDRIETLSEKDSSKIYVKIVGFLEDNAYVVTSNDPDNIIILDNCAVLPYQQFDIMKSNISDSNKGSLLFNDIFSSLIAVNDNSYDKIDLIKEQIRKEGEGVGIPININSVKNKMDSYKQSTNEGRQLTAILFAVIFLFSSVGFISSILHSLDKMIKEFGIHLMTGATIKDIALRVMYEILIIMVLAYVTAIIFLCYKQQKDIRIITILETSICVAAFSVLLCIIPVIKVYRMNISQLISRNE